ncbi:hypothetical protein GCM10028864_48180 [Microlunatus parietis]
MKNRHRGSGRSASGSGDLVGVAADGVGVAEGLVLDGVVAVLGSVDGAGEDGTGVVPGSGRSEQPAKQVAAVTMIMIAAAHRPVRFMTRG